MFLDVFYVIPLSNTIYLLFTIPLETKFFVHVLSIQLISINIWHQLIAYASSSDLTASPPTSTPLH